MSSTDPQRLQAIVTEDPLAAMPVGAQLTVKPVVFGASDAGPIPQGVLNWDFFQGAVLAVGLRTASTDHVLGSAIMLAPGLAVTATHVIMDALEGLAAGTTAGYCFGIRSGAVDLWKWRSVSYAPRDDVAFLSVELMSAVSADWAFRTLPLATKTPAVGDDITVVGFRVAECPAEEANATPPQFVIAGELLAAAGKVLAVHRPYRDAVMVPYPAIEIDCGAFGGMSGGVVLNQHGVVLGVVSTSFGTDDDAGPTFAALIEASHLDRELEIPWPPEAYTQPTTLRSLRDGLLRGLHGERS